ncbi:MAG: RNA-binding protein [Methanomassiliicoccales archaeon]|nr:RNA-binding protein [Methanomassiliicoccales archaeon]
MSEIRIRKRHRLREKEVRAITEEIVPRLGVEIFGPGDTVDRAEGSDFDVVFVNGDVVALIQDGKAFLTVRGLLKYKPSKSFVTVDMGAVPYVSKGADVMTPGIVEADRNIREGDFVWIRDVKNRVPLAIGKALVSGEEMAKKQPGKAVKTVHFVGDKLWKYGED